ncbi:MAG: DUF4339 domain-containing protein [Roseimicrobium sp.]
MNWYYSSNGHSMGPLTEERLAELARTGEVGTDTLIWHPGLPDWEPVWKLRPAIVEQLNKKAMAEQAKGTTDRVPMPVAPITSRISSAEAEERAKAGASPGIFQRLMGRLMKK